jgi:hypothetical protein
VRGEVALDWSNMPIQHATKKTILELMEPWGPNEPIAIVLADGVEHLDELEPGSVLKVVDGGFVAGMHCLYVEPV